MLLPPPSPQRRRKVPALRHWFTGPALSVAVTLAFALLLALIGVIPTVTDMYFYVYSIAALLIVGFAWYSAAKQNEKDEAQWGILSGLVEDARETRDLGRQMVRLHEEQAATKRIGGLRDRALALAETILRFYTQRQGAEPRIPWLPSEEQAYRAEQQAWRDETLRLYAAQFSPDIAEIAKDLNDAQLHQVIARPPHVRAIPGIAKSLSDAAQRQRND